ncbi:MAG: helix-turn-helix domain-containing protein [Magnetococcales bacterium]|nr:helix-turn-helix domain-containing protein [Magnetococcales bacterium]
MTNTNTKQKDWSNAYIKMRLEEAGWSLSRLAKHHGKSRTMAATAMRIPVSFEMEKQIASVLGVKPHDIWPSRYRNGLRIMNRYFKDKQGTTTHSLHNTAGEPS